jgi:hypothetical protein
MQICVLLIFLICLPCMLRINSVEAFVIIKVFRKCQLGFLAIRYPITGWHYELCR